MEDLARAAILRVIATYGDELLKAVVGPPEEEFADLCNRLRNAGPIAESSELSRVMADAVPSLASEATSVVDGMLELSMAASAHRVEIGELSTAFCEALDLDVDQCDSVRRRLGELLTIDTVVATAKGPDLIAEQHCLLSGARIFADVRPVFSEDAKRPVGVTLFGTVRLNYTRNGVGESFFLAVKLGDLEELRDEVQRALDKVEGLHGYLKALNVDYLGSETN